MSSVLKFSQKCLGFGLLVSALFLQGCNDAERGAAAGAVIGAAIGVIVATDPGPVCHGGYVTRCSEYRDRRGNYRRECRETYDSCARQYSQEIDLSLVLDGQASPAPAPVYAVETAQVAKQLSLSFDSAQKLNDGVLALQQGDKAPLLALGFSDQDFMSLSQGSGLNEASADRVAQNLDLSTESVQKALSKISSEVKVQLTDFNSEYWMSCRASGLWSTPENSFCKSSRWSGCSPQTGASLCLAK